MKIWTLSRAFALAALFTSPALAAPGHASAPSIAKLAPDSMNINLNTASDKVLMQLPGVGVVKAANIIAYRKKAPFKSVADAIKVKGVSIKMVTKWAGKAVVSTRR